MEHPTVTVDVLGTPYSIICRKRDEDRRFTADEYCDGYCDSSAHKIILRDIKTEDASDPERVERLDVVYRRNMRHELIHAMMNESGLNSECAWACNEEMVDWFALQFEKLLQIFVQTGALELPRFDMFINLDVLKDAAALTPEKLASICSTTTNAKEVN